MIRRPLRVSSLIRNELGKIILKELEFPAGTIMTVTGVETDKKLERAKVLVSAVPEESAADILSRLGKSAGFLQHLLMKKINIKPMPRIYFELDRGPENAAKIEKLLIEK